MMEIVMSHLFEKKLGLPFKTIKLDQLGPALGTAPTEPPKPEVPTIKVLDEGAKAKPKPNALWVEMPNHQWLRLVVDNRLHLDHRIYRVEMFDKTREKRVAIFRRATEATR